MPLFRRKSKARKVRMKKYYRKDGSSFELTLEQDRKTRKLDAEMNWDNPERLMDIGKNCLHNRYFDLAEWIFERVMELDPDDDEAVIQFTSSLLNQKRWGEAEEIISNHLVKDPNSSVGHQFMALIHEKRGEAEESETEIRKALESDPNNESVLWMVYWKDFKESGNDGAVSTMEDLAERHPQAWGPMYIMARHFEDLDPSKAKELYETALHREDNDSLLLAYTAFLGKSTEYREMIRVVEDSRRRRSVDFKILFNLGEAYLEEGKISEARELTAELKAHIPPPYRGRLDDFTARVRISR